MSIDGGDAEALGRTWTELRCSENALAANACSESELSAWLVLAT